MEAAAGKRSSPGKWRVPVSQSVSRETVTVGSEKKVGVRNLESRGLLSEKVFGDCEVEDECLGGIGGC